MKNSYFPRNLIVNYLEEEILEKKIIKNFSNSLVNFHNYSKNNLEIDLIFPCNKQTALSF